MDILVSCGPACSNSLHHLEHIKTCLKPTGLGHLLLKTVRQRVVACAEVAVVLGETLQLVMGKSTRIAGVIAGITSCRIERRSNCRHELLRLRATGGSSSACCGRGSALVAECLHNRLASWLPGGCALARGLDNLDVRVIGVFLNLVHTLLDLLVRIGNLAIVEYSKVNALGDLFFDLPCALDTCRD
ncbi:hypothetical protein TRAPUB_8635 [Trametes pubescens]|uniref:Uncharacterized protein n=1 Tax=Trametes pubescens TaxID=154538 RepID=A0A1M2W4R1_TRAPU|nr:hypothetical protein TRAPUB_8635 [Trametes pubescens]